MNKILSCFNFFWNAIEIFWLWHWSRGRGTNATQAIAANFASATGRTRRGELAFWSAAIIRRFRIRLWIGLIHEQQAERL